MSDVLMFKTELACGISVAEKESLVWYASGMNISGKDYSVCYHLGTVLVGLWDLRDNLIYKKLLSEFIVYSMTVSG